MNEGREEAEDGRLPFHFTLTLFLSKVLIESAKTREDERCRKGIYGRRMRYYILSIWNSAERPEE
jgi:hypothetical protein